MNKLCECGCGKEVINNTNRFIYNHHRNGEKQTLESMQKRIKTNRKKYNCDHILQSEEGKDKFKKGMLKNHNVEWAQQSIEIKEKSKRTWNQHTEQQQKDIKDKKIDTNLKIRGVNWPMQSEDVRIKSIQTCQELYGVDNVFQSKQIQEKYKTTARKNFGTDWPLQSKEIQNEIKQTLIKKYGVDNYSKTSEFRQLARRLLKESILKNYPSKAKWCPRKGDYEKEVFDELQKHCSYKILEEQEFIELHPDRYIKELNIILELYEPWHKRSCYVKHDPIRQKELENHLGCKFFIIWLDEWKENKEQVINNFKTIITSSDFFCF